MVFTYFFRITRLSKLKLGYGIIKHIMNDLETQVVKIELGESKQANSYVFALAEKIDGTEAELFIVCELPLFNPAAIPECERIAAAIAASLKRSYRNNITANTFENALAQINEELSKLVVMGKTHWLGKLNAALAVKLENRLCVATTGKISALLFRDGNFTSVSDSPVNPNPLKTFENFSEGKIRLDDLLIISTTQLFNHISVDRIKKILQSQELPEAAQEIIQILQNNIGPEVACGTILALQAEPSATEAEAPVDLQTYIPPTIESRTKDATWSDKAKNVVTTGSQIGKNFAADIKNKLNSENRPSLRGLVEKNRNALAMVQEKFSKVTKTVQPDAVRDYSPYKKFFFFSAIILVVVLLANIGLAKYFQGRQEQVQVTQANIETLQKLADDANAAILYGDEPKALELIGELKTQLDGLTNLPEEQVEQVDKIKSQLAELDNKLNKVTDSNVEELGTLTNAEHLISLPSYVGTESGRTVVSFSKTNSSIQDNALQTSESIVRSIYLRNNLAVIYNGTELFIWNFQTGLVQGAFSESVPTRDNAVGLKLYPPNNRVYMIDKSKGEVVNFLTSDRGFSSPGVSVSGRDELKTASDLAIDSNIYVATQGTILKFNAGELQDFNPAFSGSLSDKAKLYTEVAYNNLYILDPGNKRIIVLDKQGALITTLTSPRFDNLIDFSIDEANKVIYVLNGDALLKIGF